ncbi:MAG: hypothetical protein WBA46_18185 [Thermomicrobiales bacterium]
MSAVATGFKAGWKDWRDGPVDPEWDIQQSIYLERHAIYKGTLFAEMMRTNPYRSDPRVYKNISLLWNLTPRIVDFWAHMIYSGMLSDEVGKGAIPIIPGKGIAKNDAQVNALMDVIVACNRRWNWQQQMILRPRMTAALGHCLTEVIYDPVKRYPFPRTVWPGYVPHIVLDDSGIVDEYALEYQIVDDKGHVHTYRKEVDRDEFRFFRDDKPFAYPEIGAEVLPNPLGFVPAVWDRHQPMGEVRSDAAIDKSRQALFNINSLFSNARDYQHKLLLQPIAVTGQMVQRGQSAVNLVEPNTALGMAQRQRQDASAMAQQMAFIEVSEKADYRYVKADSGMVMDMFDRLKEGMLDNHPEATFWDKLADSSQVSGPGARAIIVPIEGMVMAERAGLDANTVRIYQMAITTGAYHLEAGEWDDSLDWKRKPFAAFTPDSYANGEIEFTIGPRDVVAPSKQEQIDMAIQIESLTTEWGVSQFVHDPKDVREILDAHEPVIVADYGSLDTPPAPGATPKGGN